MSTSEAPGVEATGDDIAGRHTAATGETTPNATTEPAEDGTTQIHPNDSGMPSAHAIADVKN
jgi:hypothetical protein